MEYDDKKIETMLERIMRDDILEKPSYGFTSKVMHEIYALESEATILYTPLISKKVWLVIAAIFVSLMVYVIFNGTVSDNQWFSEFDLSKYQLNLFENANVELIRMMSYCIIFIALMIGVQIILLKSYFNKRLSV